MQRYVFFLKFAILFMRLIADFAYFETKLLILKLERAKKLLFHTEITFWVTQRPFFSSKSHRSHWSPRFFRWNRWFLSHRSHRSIILTKTEKILTSVCVGLSVLYDGRHIFFLVNKFPDKNIYLPSLLFQSHHILREQKHRFAKKQLV